MWWFGGYVPAIFVRPGGHPDHPNHIDAERPAHQPLERPLNIDAPTLEVLHAGVVGRRVTVEGTIARRDRFDGDNLKRRVSRRKCSCNVCRIRDWLAIDTIDNDTLDGDRRG